MFSALGKSEYFLDFFGLGILPLSQVHNLSVSNGHTKNYIFFSRNLEMAYRLEGTILSDPSFLCYFHP